MLFNVKQLPYLSVWKHTAPAADGYLTGIEPGTNFPNRRSFEGQHQRVVKLGPGGSILFDLTIEPHGSANEVQQAESAVVALRPDVAPEVYDQPQSDWCAPQET